MSTLLVDAADLKRLVAQTAPVVARSETLHPILAHVLIERTAEGGTTFRAAGPSAHGRWAMGNGALDTPSVAVRHEHLAAIASICPAGSAVTFDMRTDAKALHVQLYADASKPPMGRWDLPTAAGQDVAQFPDEPECPWSADSDGWVLPGSTLATALHALQWLTTDEGSIQIRGGRQALASTWHAAHLVATAVNALDAPDLLVLPGAGAKVLRTVLSTTGTAPLVWVDADDWHHVVYGKTSLHLAKWAAPVEDTHGSFFGSPEVEPVRADPDALAKAVRRCSALNGYVLVLANLSTQGGPEGTIELVAQDGSSTQHVAAQVPSQAQEAKPLRALFDAKALLAALDCFYAEVAIEFRGSVVVLSNPYEGSQVALVPLVESE